MIELYFGNGLILSLVHLIPHSIGKIILIVVGVLFAADLSGTLAVVWKWRRHVNRMAAWTDGMQQMTDTFGDAITRMIRKRLEKTYPNIRTEEAGCGKAKRRGAGGRPASPAGCRLYKLIWLFLIGAFLGDIVETIFLPDHDGLLDEPQQRRLWPVQCRLGTGVCASDSVSLQV